MLNWPVVSDTAFLPVGCSSTLAPCKIAWAESVTSPVMIPLRSCAYAAGGINQIAHTVKTVHIAHSALCIFTLPVEFGHATISQTLVIAAPQVSCWSTRRSGRKRSFNEGSEYQG